MFRSKSIIDGNNNRRNFPRNSPANSVVHLVIGVKERESAAVKKHNHREIDVGRDNRDEDPKPEISRRIDGDVMSFD
jgi:hypothetical protein